MYYIYRNEKFYNHDQQFKIDDHRYGQKIYLIYAD